MFSWVEVYIKQQVIHTEHPKRPMGRLRDVASRVFAALLSISVVSCASLSGPAYQRPEVPEKAQWTRDAGTTISASEAIKPDWWRNFGDPYLDELVSKAITENIDLRVLAARIGVAEASIGQARAARLPTIDAALGADFRESSDNVFNRDIFGRGNDSRELYSISGALNWEIDVWGKLKQGVQAQEAAFKATEADWRAGYLTLLSDVSSTYFQVRQFDEQIAQQQAALEKNLQILSIYESLNREGITPKTLVMQQTAEVGRLRTNLLELKRLRQLAENALATLLGIPAGEFHVPAGHLRDKVNIVDVPAGLPSDLLSRRPDLLAAEYRILQAYRLVGQARLARLPSITLTADGGNTSQSLSNLLKAWTFGLSPRINIPIFDPNVNARVRVNEAQTRVTEEQYRRTVIKAFEEVENALVSLAIRKKQKKELERRVENLRVVSEQVRAQLQEGIVSQLEVFESERSLLTAELVLLLNHRQILTDTVALYKALGGGWPQEIVKQSG